MIRRIASDNSYHHSIFLYKRLTIWCVGDQNAQEVGIERCSIVQAMITGLAMFCCAIKNSICYEFGDQWMAINLRRIWYEFG